MLHVTRTRAAKNIRTVAHASRPQGDVRTLLVAMAVALLAVLVLVAGAPAAHAAEVQATQMKVSVWPEYDDPRVLVIYQGELDPSVQLPADVTFNLPKGAEIGMACEVDAGGGHACKPYQLEDHGEYQSLTYKVESERTVFFEYYYDAFESGGEQRDFDFVYRPSFGVETLTMEVQQPLRSSGFTLDPAFSRTTTDSQGITYHLEDFPNVTADQEPVAVSVSYSKPDNEPSITAENQGSAGGETGPAATGGGGLNSGLIVVVAVVAFAVLLFGGYKVFRPAAVQTGTKARKGRGPGAAQAKAAGGKGGSGSSGRGGGRGGGSRKFCTQCGTELEPRARFCSECGDEQ